MSLRKPMYGALVATLAAGSLAVPALAATKTIKVGDDYFIKKGGGTVSVKKGTTVKWSFEGSSPHNVTASGAAKFSSKTQSSGTYKKKVSKKGTYKIVCTLHSGMKMTLKVK